MKRTNIKFFDLISLVFNMVIPIVDTTGHNLRYKHSYKDPTISLCIMPHRENWTHSVVWLMVLIGSGLRDYSRATRVRAVA